MPDNLISVCSVEPCCQGVFITDVTRLEVGNVDKIEGWLGQYEEYRALGQENLDFPDRIKGDSQTWRFIALIKYCLRIPIQEQAEHREDHHRHPDI